MIVRIELQLDRLLSPQTHLQVCSTIELISEGQPCQIKTSEPEKPDLVAKLQLVERQKQELQDRLTELEWSSPSYDLNGVSNADLRGRRDGYEDEAI